jgi:hypothetical protein
MSFCEMGIGFRIAAKAVGRGSWPKENTSKPLARIEKCRESQVTNRHFWVVLVDYWLSATFDETAIPFQKHVLANVCSVASWRHTVFAGDEACWLLPI